MPLNTKRGHVASRKQAGDICWYPRKAQSITAVVLLCFFIVRPRWPRCPTAL